MHHLTRPRLTFAALALTCALLPAPAPALAGGPTPASPPAATATLTPVTTPLTDDAPSWRHAVAAHSDERVDVLEVTAHSPTMGRDVPLVVITPTGDAPRPTIYLLNGADGGEGSANWIDQSDVLDFYADKNVTVVIPMAGAFSYYTDWLEPAPDLGGVQKWETFLTEELPGPLEDRFHGNGQRAVAGISMSATSSLLLAQHHPGFYRAVGSMSGCAATTTGAGNFGLGLTLQRGGATPEMMWGPVDGPVFREHDALINAERLRGTEIFLSNGSGLAGPWDLPSSPYLAGQTQQQASESMATTIGVGGAIEAASNSCTHDLKAKLDSLGIPADVDFTDVGTHTWGYWQDALRSSWPTFARAFNLADDLAGG